MKKFAAALALSALVMGSWFAYRHFAGADLSKKETTGKEEAIIRPSVEYWAKMRNDPQTGLLPFEAVYKAQADAKYFAAQGFRGALDLEFEEMGPDNQGGRTRAYLIDKDNNQLMFSGGVSGGLWKSTNAGASWTKIPGMDDFNNMIVSCITQAPNGNIYFGTGEYFGFFNNAVITGATGFIGGGVWMSSDKGETWNNITPAVDPNESSLPWAFVNDIVADQSGTVWIGIKGGTSANKGLQMLDSNDPNQDISNGPVTATPAAAANATVEDIELSPDGSIHISCGNKYFRRLAGEANFTRVSDVPFPASPERMEIASAPSDANVIYVATSGGSFLSGVWKSTDKGNSFTQIAGSTTSSSQWQPLTQGRYAFATAVHPTNPDIYFLGGLDCYRYTSAAGFVKISNWNYEPTHVNYVHADIHNFIFRPDNANAMYVVSDGGINYTNNSTASNIVWATKNAGYITTQFYSATAKNYTGELLGGTQDNGNWYIDYNGNTQQWGLMIKGGDGGDVAASTINPNLLFAEYVYGDLSRSSNNGASFGNMLDTHIDPDGNNMPGNGDPGSAPFIAQFELWENPNDTNFLTQSKFVLGTNNNIWITQEALNLIKTPTWFKLVDTSSFKWVETYYEEQYDTTFVNDTTFVIDTTEVLMDTVKRAASLSGQVSAIDFAPDGETLFVGTENGKLYRITGLNQVYTYPNASQTTSFWAGQQGVHVALIQNFGNGRYVTGIDVFEADSVPTRLVVSLGNYGQSSHVFFSQNASDSAPSFTDISTAGTGLPDMPVYTCLFDKANHNNILIGTELGLYSTNDAGSNWSLEDDGLPRCPITKLYNHKLNDAGVSTGVVDNVIVVATYGRGLFRTRTLQFTSVADNVPQAGSSKLLELYPNPAQDQATLALSINNKTDVRVEIYSLNGSLVMTTVHKNLPMGRNTLNLKTRDLTNGTYLVKVSGNGFRDSKKLIVLN